ncbi:MAG: BamA/TamA family outer membrane protein [Pyrinomonadaceae bacterium]|nr:BamA/TamA family outer membrane protein [Pyrinomonadaceae bacterium]
MPADGNAVAPGHNLLVSRTLRGLSVLFVLTAIVCAVSVVAVAGGMDEYEGRLITTIEVVFEGSPADPAAQSDFLTILKVAPNAEFSAVRVRDSLQALFDSGRIANARVEVFEAATKTGPLRLRFVIQRQVQIGEVRLELGTVLGTPIAEDELRARLNLIQPGTRLSKQIIVRNADEIQIYLRDRGYFNTSIEPVETVDPAGTRAIVTYRVTLGEQSRVGAFNIDITGFDAGKVRPLLRLAPNVPFTREALGEDVKRIKAAIIADGYLAPQLDEPRVERDAELNLMTISLKGAVGPKVKVNIPDYPLSEKTMRELLPVMREGNIDVSAIEEGARRLRNKLQEEGYFFAEISSVCKVTPPTLAPGSNVGEETCESLNPEALSGRSVEITYQIERGRRFRLTDIRITGTNKLFLEDVEADLKSQKASALGLIPFLGYGRGYTSLTLLEQDRRIIRNYMRDLGYRRAEAEVLQGVSINGENLIITFNVIEGPLTRIAGVEVRGNTVYTEQRLRDRLRTVIGAPFSRSQARADSERVLALYAREGYVNAQINFSVVELPKKGEEEQIRLIYSITNEGEKVFVNRIIINGVTGSAQTQRTKRDAIARAITLMEGDVLRADRVSESERELYLTDAYRQVIIRTEPAGETASGFKKEDVIIDVEEKKPRVMDYGGGFSTDTGPLGLLEFSNVNLMNKLRHGAMRLRASLLQQLVRFEYLDPRFARYGERRFAPLAFSVEYQRDSTVTRFFRSTIDRGTNGIVQRLDENGNPVDVFGVPVDEPTINRFIVALETQRVLDRRTRTIVFARYAYEDVRLFNLQSLLIRPILQPDRAIRLSRLGGSFVRDTRERCERGLIGTVRTAEGSEPGSRGEICRYNQVDSTRGEFLTMDYALALRQLGGNISFNRFQASYRRYYKMNSLRGTVFAGNATLGLANIFNPRDRDDNGTIDEIDLTLPISERFFSGGSSTLRGFSFEEAGPRQALIPVGVFHDQNGEVVSLNPFTVPVGGNAVAIVNLEARIPLTRSIQVVPFYDGGNVFRRVGELFGKNDDNAVPPGNLLAAIDAANLRSRWSHTVGLGFRFHTPLGGALAIDYGFLFNPPKFLIPQQAPDFQGTPAVYRLKQTQVHFRFTQTF